MDMPDAWNIIDVDWAQEPGGGWGGGKEGVVRPQVLKDLECCI